MAKAFNNPNPNRAKRSAALTADEMPHAAAPPPPHPYAYQGDEKAGTLSEAVILRLMA